MPEFRASPIERFVTRPTKAAVASAAERPIAASYATPGTLARQANLATRSPARTPQPCRAPIATGPEWRAPLTMCGECRTGASEVARPAGGTRTVARLRLRQASPHAAARPPRSILAASHLKRIRARPFRPAGKHFRPNRRLVRWNQDAWQISRTGAGEGVLGAPSRALSFSIARR